jgi:conjugal transfer/entry exclusion protein
MAYVKDTLISRRGYSGFGGTLSDIGGAFKDIGAGALTFYGQSQQAQGAAMAAQATNRDLAAALAAQQGPGLGTILLVGGAAVAAIFLFKKKKQPTP